MSDYIIQPGEEFLISQKEGGLSMEESVTAYPFTVITEIYQAGKTYGEKALEAIKEVVAYPYEAVTQALTKQEPTGVITSENTLKNLFQNALKPPWIFIILGGIGIWVYSIFKKR